MKAVYATPVQQYVVIQDLRTGMGITLDAVTVIICDSVVQYGCIGISIATDARPTVVCYSVCSYDWTGVMHVDSISRMTIILQMVSLYGCVGVTEPYAMTSIR